jgi:hypothetical protein
MDIGSIKYAPDWVHNFLGEDHNFTAFAVFRKYDADAAAKYPNLRDRTAEMRLAVEGISVCMNTQIWTKTGKEWAEYGLDPVGAQFVQEFTLIVA